VARQYLDDAFGPDGVRVTIAIETASDQLDRDRRQFGVGPGSASVLLRLWRGLQASRTGSGRGRWVVEVEADTGWRARLHLTDRDAAAHLAKRLWNEVNEGGLPALKEAVRSAAASG